MLDEVMPVAGCLERAWGVCETSAKAEHGGPLVSRVDAFVASSWGFGGLGWRRSEARLFVCPLACYSTPYTTKQKDLSPLCAAARASSSFAVSQACFEAEAKAWVVDMGRSR